MLEAVIRYHLLEAVKSTLLPAIDNGRAQSAVKVAPALEEHMIAAQNLDKQLQTAQK